MSNGFEQLSFFWEDVGELEIEVVDNMSATLRYFPSERFIEETVAKFRKKPANQSTDEKQINTPPERKSLPDA